MLNPDSSISIAYNSLLSRLRYVASIARVRSFDTKTVDGRSSERLRRIFWSATTAALAKVINTIALLVSVPITLGYLGNERYGLWMTITAVVAFLGFADLGIGNVILNLISDANGKDHVESARRSITNAIFILTGIAIFLGSLFVLFYPLVNWPAFFNVSSSIARDEAGPAMIVFISIFLLNLPLSIIPRIQMGYQEGYFSSIWQAVSNLLGLAALVISVKLQAGLPWLVLIITGFPVLGNLLNAISLFGFQRSFLLPKWQDLDRSISKEILHIGFLFLILQVTNAFIYSSDNIVIARVLGPESVTDYAVPMRLFVIFPNVLYMFLTALWPAYGEATIRGDASWVRKTLTKSIKVTFSLTLIYTGLIVIFGQVILNIWTNSQVDFSCSLMIGMAVWTIISAILSAIAMYLNGINKIGFQTIFSIITAVIALVAKSFFARTSGLPGVIWAQVMASSFFMLLPYAIYLKVRFALDKKEPS